MEIGDGMGPGSLDEKAMAGRKLSWGELAEELEATKIKLIRAQLDSEALKGSEEARLAGEKKLAEVQEEMAEVRRAAALAIAVASLRVVRYRDLLSPERLAETWYTAYREFYLAKGQPQRNWEELTGEQRSEVVAIAARVHGATAEYDRNADVELEKVGEMITGQGDELAEAMKKLIAITQSLQAVWNAGILPGIRMLHNVGIDILPPGTIVHGVSIPSQRPHRPE